jgi:predicted ArsR family transcriptional regulator
MQTTRKKIIRLLKRNGGLTTDELSRTLGISTTAVRRHLRTLEIEEMVGHRTEQRGMGRPSYVYEVTDNAPEVFAQSYSTFAKSIIEELADLDGIKRPAEWFDQRQEKRQRQYITLTKGSTLSDRVTSLARLMESEGRITTWQQLNENQFILREHNCPLQRLARKFDHPCRCEISLLKKTLKAQVKRVNHILNGDVACVYLIEGPENGTHREREAVPQWIQAHRPVPSEPSVGERLSIQ